MEVSNSVAGRPAWYDRNPTTRCKTYSATVAPAGTTVRWSYTVPTNKKAYVDVFTAQVLRVTAAGVVGTVLGFVRITASDATTGDFGVSIRTNGVGDRAALNIGSGIPMVAGDAIVGDTYDDSTTGTAQFDLNLHLTEFDS